MMISVHEKTWFNSFPHNVPFDALKVTSTFSMMFSTLIKYLFFVLVKFILSFADPFNIDWCQVSLFGKDLIRTKSEESQ